MPTIASGSAASIKEHREEDMDDMEDMELSDSVWLKRETVPGMGVVLCLSSS